MHVRARPAMIAALQQRRGPDRSAERFRYATRVLLRLFFADLPAANYLNWNKDRS